MGRTAVEAQLRGMPVIVPDSGGSSELVDDGVTGVTFEAGSAESLAEAYERLAGDAALRAEIGAQAREVATVRHDPRAYALAFAAALTKRRDRAPSRPRGRST